MAQLDGTCDSKVANTTTISQPTKLSRKDTQARPHTRKRCASLFTNKKRINTTLSQLDMSDAEEPTHDNTPMRIVSPRATDLEPPAPDVKEKRRSFTMMRRHTTMKKKKKSDSSFAESGPVPADVPLTLVEAMNVGGHIPVTEAPCLTPLHAECVPGLPERRDSVVVGSADAKRPPTREAALTSHPVIEIDVLESEESSDEFKTPMSGRSVELEKT